MATLAPQGGAGGCAFENAGDRTILSRGRQTGAAAREARRRGWAIAVSLAAHAAALAVLAWTTPVLRIPLAEWRPDVTIELQRPKAATRTTREAASASPRAAPAAATASAAPQVAAPAPVPARRPLVTPPPAPLPLAARPVRPPAAPAPFALPSIPAPGPAPRPGPTSPPAETGQSGGDVRGAVRAAIGCNHEDFLKLSPAERADCERRMAEAPPHSGAYVDPIPPLKRGAFDRQAAADARRRDHEGPMSNPIGPCAPSTPGSSFGVGCLPPSAMHRIPFGATPRAPAPDPEP